MSSIFSLSDTSDTYGAFFNTSGSSYGKSNSSSIFDTTILGDYSMVKSGTYKKLLNAYYDATESKKIDKSEVDSTSDLVTVKGNAKSLYDSMSDLSDASLYKVKSYDEKGNAEYDKDSIKKAVSSFVDDYNSYIESAGNVNTTFVLKSTVKMIEYTSKNSGLLSDIGIKIGSDNKLTFDEEKFGESNISTVKSLFQGNGSYGSRVQSLANASYRVANSNAYSNTHASSYTYDGTYSVLGTSNGSFNTWL